MKNFKIESGKRYLVTGGTGFLGKELIKRLVEQGAYVNTIARNEGNLITLQQRYPDNIKIFYGDITNTFTVEQAMVDKIEGVFHLAAFKHVTAAETFARECTNSNIIGSINVLDVASSKKVKFIIGISTDKAAQVAGVYGATKLVMEKLFEQYEVFNPYTSYRVVRYGNVLYSTGSVLCKWKELIEQDKKVKVTEPEATRFFWTIDSALDLVFDCLENADNASPYVPEMKSIKILNLLIAMYRKYGSGTEPNLEIIGLQPGENLHEKILKDGPGSGETEQYTIEEIMELI